MFCLCGIKIASLLIFSATPHFCGRTGNKTSGNCFEIESEDTVRGIDPLEFDVSRFFQLPKYFQFGALHDMFVH